MRQIKVSAVQMRVLSRERNILKILSYIKKAEQERSNLILFPETSFGTIRNPSEEKDLEVIKKSAKDNNIYVVINGYFKIKNKIFNRSYLIDNFGKILGFYDKIYLWKPEVGKVNRGNKIKVFDTPIGKIGICICWDLFFPRIIEEMASKGAQIILCSSYWDNPLKKESRFIEYAPTVFAYENMNFFVYSNALFKGFRGETSKTQISAPWGEFAKINQKEGIISSELYFNKLNQFKKNFAPVFWEKKLK